MIKLRFRKINKTTYEVWEEWRSSPAHASGREQMSIHELRSFQKLTRLLGLASWELDKEQP